MDEAAISTTLFPLDGDRRLSVTVRGSSVTEWEENLTQLFGLPALENLEAEIRVHMSFSGTKPEPSNALQNLAAKRAAEETAKNVEGEAVDTAKAEPRPESGQADSPSAQNVEAVAPASAQEEVAAPPSAETAQARAATSPVAPAPVCLHCKGPKTYEEGTNEKTGKPSGHWVCKSCQSGASSAVKASTDGTANPIQIAIGKGLGIDVAGKSRDEAAAAIAEARKGGK